MSHLEPVAEDIWTAAAPLSLVGLRIGTRMTVIRLSGGGVALHSPVPADLEMVAEINALGPVRHIICPNSFHHLYAGDAQRLWPDALLHGPAALQRKRRDLHFQVTLDEHLHPELAADLDAVSIDGSLLNETVLYHRASRTLISADLVENFHHCKHAPTRLYLRLNGALGLVTWPRLMRPLYYRRGLARASVDRILAWPFERAVIAHGEIIREQAREAVRTGMAWLR
ncbi:MAG: DUF4336 domain-containing protein [Perlucidibaca sp.]